MAFSIDHKVAISRDCGIRRVFMRSRRLITLPDFKGVSFIRHGKHPEHGTDTECREAFSENGHRDMILPNLSSG